VAASMARVTANELQEVACQVFAPERAYAACVGVLERAHVDEARRTLLNSPSD
jgi:hypothetical protein